LRTLQEIIQNQALMSSFTIHKEFDVIQTLGINGTLSNYLWVMKLLPGVSSSQVKIWHTFGFS
jgi:hypothetical protein